MHTLQDHEIKEKFITGAKEVTETIQKFAEPQYMGDDAITLRRFMELMGTYVTCMNKESIPCIQTATDQLKETEFTHACNEAQTTYLEIFNNYIQQREPYPVTSEELTHFHLTAYASAVKTYTKLVFASDKDDTGRKQIFLNELDEIYKIFEKENNDKSANRCRMTIEACFRSRMDKVKAQGYFCQGGYGMYQHDTQLAISEYHKTLCKGPTADVILTGFLQYYQAENDAIKSGDKLSTQWNQEKLTLSNNLEATNKQLRITQAKQEEQDAEIAQLLAEKVHINEKVEKITEYQSDIVTLTARIENYERQLKDAEARHSAQMVATQADLSAANNAKGKSWWDVAPLRWFNWSRT